MNILHYDASASDAAASHTRRLSADLVGKLKAANPEASIVYRDVAADRRPHVDMTFREAWLPEGEKDASLTASATRSKAVVDELKAADVVIESPMYDFTLPSTLKASIDHVSIAGQTFQYTATGLKGLPKGDAYLALSSGGLYSQGPSAAVEHLATYFTALFGFLGTGEVEVVRAEGIAYGPKQDDAAMASAQERIATLIGGWSVSRVKRST